MATIVCIYCKNPIDDASLSKSDIIPYFLGNGLHLEDAICKKCNNSFNSQVEQPLRDQFQYLRSGLDIRGRLKQPVKLIADVDIASLGKRMRVYWEHIEKKGIPPFKFKGNDGKEYYAVIGSKDHVENHKKEISQKIPEIKWHDAKDKGEIEITGNALPIGTMNGHLGRRLAAKIAFERLCQKKSTTVILDRIYDNIRNYIRYGTGQRTMATLIYNEQIMAGNMNFPFPYHIITLTNDVKHNKIVGVISLFGLYYYLVLISEYLPICASWDNCIAINPQMSTGYELLLRGTMSINIPGEAWVMNDAKLKLAREFAISKFKTALESQAVILGNAS